MQRSQGTLAAVALCGPLVRQRRAASSGVRAAAQDAVVM